MIKKDNIDIDWIFEHGKEIVITKQYSNLYIEILGKCMGFKCNEIQYRVKFIRDISKPFLLKRDKKGFLENCEKIKKSIRIHL